MIKRRYSELRQFQTFEEKYEYLRLKGAVGEATFGFDRYLNQGFYRSKEWKDVRNFVIARDNGCDMGQPGHEIHENILVHHMNPMTVEAIVEGDVAITDPEYLISVKLKTHNAIHYGDARLLDKPFVERRPGDTKLW